MLAAAPGFGQTPYSYVKISLEVPWALYFVFLTLVCVPFMLVIVLAWRHASADEAQQRRRDDANVHAGALPRDEQAS